MTVPPIVPWEVAEAVGLRLAKLAPRSLRITGHDHGRIRRVAAEGLEPQPQVVPESAKRRSPAEALVWISDPEVPEAGVRETLITAAHECLAGVVIVELVAPGRGIGPQLLRRIDPGLSFIESDELTSKRGTPKQRKPWEARARWVVAEAAAWRFAPDAEAARSAFRLRLPTATSESIVMQCRRLQQRYGRAHELYALAAEELSRRGDRAGVQQVRAELVIAGGAPLGVVDRVRVAAVAACGGAQVRNRRRAG